MNVLIEVTAVLLNLAYLILLMQEKIACWFFGVLGSILSIYLFYCTGLYSESILYVFYVIIGIYGYQLWQNKKNKQEELKVKTLSRKVHLLILSLGLVAALIVGYLFDQNTDAVNPYLDASTTIFSFIASFLEAKKILSSWLFWLFINGATVILYLQQDLHYYLLLTVVYFGFSIIGYLKWKKSYDLMVIN